MKPAANVAVLTEQYVFRGSILLRGQRRVSDTLNDKLTNIIQINDVKVYRYTQLDEPIDSLSSLHLRKPQIHVVVILQEQSHDRPEVPTQRKERARAPGSIFVGPLRLRGTLVFAGKQKQEAAMLREHDLFIPIQKAVIDVIQEDKADVCIPATVALVNNELLVGYHYSEDDMIVI